MAEPSPTTSQFRPLPTTSLIAPAATLLAMSSAAVDAGVPISEAAMCLGVAAVLVANLRKLPASETPAPWPKRRLALAAVGLGFGVAVGSWLFAAIAWMHLSRSAITRHFNDAERRRLRAWWPVAVMAVPWVWADAWWLGWQMRLSSASAAGGLLASFLPSLSQQGTTLVIDGIAIDVAASCAGLGLLQATLTLGLAGVAFASRNAFVTVASVPLLVLVAWGVNVVRIVALSLVAVFGSPELAGKTLHDAIGYGLLVVLATLGWAAFDRFSGPRSSVPAAEAV